MSSSLADMLLIQSFNLDTLIEDYRVFFLSLLPSLFLVACLVEYFDRMDTFALVRRAFIAILILTSVSSFYKSSIDMSIQAADGKLADQKQSNVFLMDFIGAKNFVQDVRSSNKESFYKDNNIISGSLKFLKHHLFDSFVNDGFTTTVYFIGQLCIQIIKVVYSLVYYLGFGLIGIPCLLYLFSTMGNILRGAILSYVWCLIVPHILVFVLSMISSEINTGYSANQIIGGSIAGTVLLFIMTLLIAFTPLIGMMIVNGSGMAQAGGIIASMGANYVMNLPKQTVNNGAMLLSGQKVGPKMSLLKFGGNRGGRVLKNALKKSNPLSYSKRNQNSNNSKSISEGLRSSNSYSNSKAQGNSSKQTNQSIKHKGSHGAHSIDRTIQKSDRVTSAANTSKPMSSKQNTQNNSNKSNNVRASRSSSTRSRSTNLRRSSVKTNRK